MARTPARGRGACEDAARLLDQLAVVAVRHLPTGDISLTTAAVLARLEREGPVRLTLLAVREGVTQPSMTQLVQRLVREGLAERTSEPADRRVVLVAITDAGRRLLAERRDGRVERLAELLAQLPAEDEEALAAALRATMPTLQRLTSPASGAAAPFAPPRQDPAVPRGAVEPLDPRARPEPPAAG